MKSYLFAILFFLLSIVAGGVSAQDTPQPVLDAFADFNERNGTTYTTNSLAWEWREVIFGNRSLECDNHHQDDGPVVGFIVIISDLNGDRWEYHISYDPDIFRLCSSPIVRSETGISGPSNSEPPAVTPIQTDPNCDDIPIRLRVGQLGRVIPYGIPNNVREEAGTSNDYVGEIPNSGVFTVLDGPRCTDAGAWFQVDYQGMIGWTIESFYNEFFLEPLRPNLTQITPENINRLQPLATISTEESGNVDVVISGYSIFVAGDELRRYSFNSNVAAPVSIHERRTEFGRIETMREVFGGLMIINSEGEVYRLQNYQDTEFQRTISQNDWMRHAISRNADFVVSAVDSSEEGQSELWLYDLNLNADSEPIALLTTERFVNFAFSPDSQYFAAAYSGKITIWETENWTILAEQTVEDALLMQEIAFSPVDNRLFVSYFSRSNPVSDMAIFSINGEQITALTENHASAFGQFGTLHFGSDGQSLLSTITVINDSRDVNFAEFAVWDRGTAYNTTPAIRQNETTIDLLYPKAITISDDGTLILTVDNDGLMRIMGIPAE